VRRTPAGRLGSADDIARIVLFLSSPLSDWIVGQTIVADGGLHLSV
jgi:NAD(P)-dependent dehydrogenase (short-subunit alcohol dehydrogenase family)